MAESFQQSNKIIMHPPKIRNKTPNPIQTSAEQLLQEAQIHQNKEVRAPMQRIVDEEELESYKLTKRKEFEDNLRMQRHHMGTWIKYATWEESLQEFRRARTIFERALDIDYKNASVWLKYAEMEMRHKFLNHARNIWERACTYLPRMDQFWYKYSYMEEMLGNYKRAREIFEKWITWKPEEKAWLSYIKFEERMGETDRCREIMYRYLEAFPRLTTYLKVAKFEIKRRNYEYARKIYEKAAEDLAEEAFREEYFMNFALFETKQKEIERARAIYKLGLENIPKERAARLYEAYIAFEKQVGSKENIDLLIFNKRRLKYKEKLAENQFNYDVWFDLLQLELNSGNRVLIQETFDAAVSKVPPVDEKRFWRRFIYLFYCYAAFLELDFNDIEGAQKVLEQAVKLVPHKKFSFSKLWIKLAHLLIRKRDLEAARKVFGIALGKCPSEKVFLAYTELELQLANLERCRTLYEKFIELFPENPKAWIKYAELEKSLEEYERFRAIFELAIGQNTINMPELIWKAYIDSEAELQEYDKARKLYLRLLEKSKNVKVWISYAQFEASLQEKTKFRDILRKGEEYFMENPDLKEERVVLLETWLDLERKYGDEESVERIRRKLPKKIKKHKKITSFEGEVEEDAGWEEYIDYIFPEDLNQMKNMNILKKAHEWKKMQEKAQESNSINKTKD